MNDDELETLADEARTLHGTIAGIAATRRRLEEICFLARAGIPSDGPRASGWSRWCSQAHIPVRSAARYVANHRRRLGLTADPGHSGADPAGQARQPPPLSAVLVAARAVQRAAQRLSGVAGQTVIGDLVVLRSALLALGEAEVAVRAALSVSLVPPATPTPPPARDPVSTATTAALRRVSDERGSSTCQRRDSVLEID